MAQSDHFQPMCVRESPFLIFWTTPSLLELQAADICSFNPKKESGSFVELNSGSVDLLYHSPKAIILCNLIILLCCHQIIETFNPKQVTKQDIFWIIKHT
jgi:hypothetical protein